MHIVNLVCNQMQHIDHELWHMLMDVIPAVALSHVMPCHVHACWLWHISAAALASSHAHSVRTRHPTPMVTFVVMRSHLLTCCHTCCHVFTPARPLPSWTLPAYCGGTGPPPWYMATTHTLCGRITSSASMTCRTSECMRDSGLLVCRYYRYYYRYVYSVYPVLV
jgi:hypothetical protein